MSLCAHLCRWQCTYNDSTRVHSRVSTDMRADSNCAMHSSLLWKMFFHVRVSFLLSCDAMIAWCMLWPCVRPSVCRKLKFCQNSKRRITQTMPHNSPGTLRFLVQKRVHSRVSTDMRADSNCAMHSSLLWKMFFHVCVSFLLSCDAMIAWCMLWPCVRPSVCCKLKFCQNSKRRITQTMPHNSPGTLRFLVQKNSGKFEWGHLHCRRQMQVG